MKTRALFARKWAALTLFSLGCAMEYAGAKASKASRYELGLMKRRHRAERRLLLLAFSPPPSTRRQEPQGTETFTGRLCRVFFWSFAMACLIILLIAVVNKIV